MEENKYKYQEYLDNYENCPMKKCMERDVPAVRWVYSDITTKDFEPQIFSKRYPDKNFTTPNKSICEDFSLSMWDSFESAKKIYMHYYEKKTRPGSKEVYISQRGGSMVRLNLKKEDGVSDEPNDKGHFSFFEYNNFDYLQRVDFTQQYSIFAYNDSDNNISG